RRRDVAGRSGERARADREVGRTSISRQQKHVRALRAADEGVVSHTCHSPDCTRPVPPRMLFCLPHWRALPKKVQDAVWREYRSGQEIDKKPSLRYLSVQRLACAHSVFKPDDEEAALLALVCLKEAVNYSR